MTAEKQAAVVEATLRGEWLCEVCLKALIGYTCVKAGDARACSWTCGDELVKANGGQHLARVSLLQPSAHI
jgi:hypothetical protein